MRTYVAPVYEKDDNISAPVVDITNGTTVGFRYLQFGANSPKTVTVCMNAKADVRVNVRVDAYDGKQIAAMDCTPGAGEFTAPVNAGVIGKHAVYFEFVSGQEGAIAEFDRFTFD